MSNQISSDVDQFLKALQPATVIATVFGLGQILQNGLVTKNQLTNSMLHIAHLIYTGSLFIFAAPTTFLKIQWYIRDFNKPGRTLAEKLIEFAVITNDFTMAALYSYHFIAAKRFRKLIDNFSTVINEVGLGAGAGCSSKRPMSPLVIFCWLSTISCVALGMVEDVLFGNMDGQLGIQRGVSANNGTQSCGYFCADTSYWNRLVPLQNPVFDMILVVYGRIVALSWFLSEMFAIILCQVLSLSLQNLNEAIQRNLIQNYNRFPKQQLSTIAVTPSTVEPIPSIEVTSEGSFDKITKEQAFTWDVALQQLSMLDDLVFETQRYVGPLILFCYFCMGSILAGMYLWMAPNIPFSLSTSDSFYIYYSSIYYCCRVAVVTYFVSKVHSAGQGILRSVEHCSSSSYFIAAERIERKLTGNPIGIRLFGTFLITSHSFVSIISFIFTTEIVLLQIT